MIKRLLPLLAMLTLLGGCSSLPAYPDDDMYHPETDYPYALHYPGNPYSIAVSQTGYYFWAPDYLFYTDWESMSPAPVCTNPNCLHWNEPDIERRLSCQAYFAAAGTECPFFEQNGSLYIFHDAGQTAQSRRIVLSSVSADGARRKLLADMGDSPVFCAALHRGYLYQLCTTYDEKGLPHTALQRFGLHRAAAGVNTLYTFPDTVVVASVLQVFGNYLFFTQMDTALARWQCIRYDLRDGSMMELLPSDDSFGASSVTFLGEHLYVTKEAIADDGSTETQLWRCGMEGEDARLLRTGNEPYTSDDRYLYACSGLYGQNSESPDIRLLVLDAEGVQIDTIDLLSLPEISVPVFVSLYPTMGDQMLFAVMDAGGIEGMRWFYFFFSKAEIGSGQITPHCFWAFDMGEYMPLA